MDGKMPGAGAVAGLTRVRNPITLARAVMEKSEHVMMVGAGTKVCRAKKMELSIRSISGPNRGGTHSKRS